MRTEIKPVPNGTKVWKKILISSLTVIALALGVLACIGSYEYLSYKCRDYHYHSLEKRVSDHITMIHGSQGGNSYCRLKDIRTGHYTTPKLQHIFLNYSSEDSLVVFRTDDRMRGYLNLNTGKIVIPAQYDRAWNFSEGLAAVIQNGEISFILPDGQPAFETVYPFYFDDDHSNYSFQFHQGLCAMLNRNRQWGLINIQGEWVVEPIYNSMDKPQYGYRIVTEGSKFGLLTADGHVALPTEYDFIRPASSQRGFTIAKDGYAKIVDPNLNTIVQFVHDGIYPLLSVNNYYDEEDDDERKNQAPKYWRYRVGGYNGVIDSDGHVIIPAKYEEVNIVNDHLFEAVVEFGGDCYLFDAKGQLIGKESF